MAGERHFIRRVRETRDYYEIVRGVGVPSSESFADLVSDRNASSLTRLPVGSVDVSTVEEVRVMTEAEVAIMGYGTPKTRGQ